MKHKIEGKGDITLRLGVLGKGPPKHMRGGLQECHVNNI
jgi:hypothetical protein